MTNWRWVSARCRGTSHLQDNTRCQDAYACVETTQGTFVAVLCDGAGSASKGGQGASLVTRILSQRASHHYTAGHRAPDDETIRAWLSDARDVIALAASKRSLRPRDFASTLICVMTNAEETVVVHVGDGGVVAKSASSGEWQTLTWPAHGEYASTTFFVTDDPQPIMIVERYDEPFSAIVAFTDGLERLALDFAQHKPHVKFFDGVSRPVFESDARGQDRALSMALGRYLDSSAVNARTDDDKTLMIAVRR